MKRKQKVRTKSQAVLEFTVLFAIATAALITSFYFINVDKGAKSHFEEAANAMAGDSLEWEE